MIDSFKLAAGQLFHHSLRRFLIGGIFGSGCVFVMLWLSMWWLLASIDVSTVPVIGWLVTNFGSIFEWLAGLLIISTLGLVTLLLYPGLVLIIVSIFLDHVAYAVEVHHYPNLSPARPQKLSEAALQSIRFFVMMVALNLLALPIYALLFFLTPFNILFFYLLNGYLVGREYFELVALRRLEPASARQLRKSSRGSLLIAGAMLTFLMTIPIINLATPIFSAAFMTHFFHRLAGKKGVIVN